MPRFVYVLAYVLATLWDNNMAMYGHTRVGRIVNSGSRKYCSTVVIMVYRHHT